jgi:hypothetical protein
MPMRINRQLLGWGGFFILLGVIPLAVRGGLLSRDVVEQWPSLWPLLLIGWGIGLLLRRTPADWIGGALTTVTFGVMGGGLIATGLGGVPVITGCGPSTSTTPFEARTGSLDQSGAISVELPCGRLDIETAAGADWTISGRDRDGAGPKIDASASRVAITAGDQPSDFMGSRFEWQVTVPRDPDVGLSVTVNAGEGVADLSGAHLSGTSFTLNAGTFRLDAAGVASLASISGTVNAGTGRIGLPDRSMSASFTLNAGTLDVCVPQGTGLRVNASSTLASTNLDSLGLVKTGDHTWTTQNVSGAATVIDLSVSANVGSFSLIIGGSCGA